MKTSAMQDNFGVKELKQYGYIPYDVYNKSVSTALEYCYDDWCIAQMAKDLGKIDDYNYFMRRSSGYRTYFDKEYKLMNGFQVKVASVVLLILSFHLMGNVIGWKGTRGNILSLFLMMCKD